MNFYQHQDRARRRTRLLALWFFTAVVLVVLALNALAWGAMRLVVEPDDAPLTLAQWLEGPSWVFVTGLTLLVIVGTSLVTALRLRGGGPALAGMLKARRLDADTRVPAERRLLNVVEEMAIASGVPVPAVYVLDGEAGINAFVAGTRPSETVMVVTRGALEHFTRDELQGVVAHEFSHIFNHDMRLNIHLMGALAGLVVIAQLGRFLLRAGSHGRGRDTAQLVMVGIAVLAIGYLGSALAAVIKAAISRQREFLADASAVQFTRNPQGIAGALYRIQTHATGSRLDNPHAEDLSHFCIAESVRYFFGALMATHPPLAARIAAIEPGFVPRDQTPSEALATQPASAAPRAAAERAGGAGFSADVSPSGLDGTHVADSVGQPAGHHLAHAAEVRAALPAPLLDAAHQPAGAAHLVLALFLARSAAAAQRAAWRAALVRGTYDAGRLTALATPLAALPARQRLPLVELALPALKTLDAPARAGLLATLRAVAAADGRFSVFEFAMLRILDDHLGADAARAPRVRHYAFAPVADALRLLLSVLAHAGHAREVDAEAAFAAAWAPFSLPGNIALVARGACRMEALQQALGELAALTPLLKRNVILAAADCVIHDGTVSAAEAELLEAVALTLDCPLPPLL